MRQKSKFTVMHLAVCLGNAEIVMISSHRKLSSRTFIPQGPEVNDALSMHTSQFEGLSYLTRSSGGKVFFRCMAMYSDGLVDPE